MDQLKQKAQYCRKRADLWQLKQRSKEVEAFYTQLEELRVADRDPSSTHVDPTEGTWFRLPLERVSQYYRSLHAAAKASGEWPYVLERPVGHCTLIFKLFGSSPEAPERFGRFYSRALYRHRQTSGTSSYSYNVYKYEGGWTLQLSNLRVSARAAELQQLGVEIGKKTEVEVAPETGNWWIAGYERSFTVQVTDCYGELESQLRESELVELSDVSRGFSLAEEYGGVADQLSEIESDELHSLLKRSPQAAQLSQILALPALAASALSEAQHRLVLLGLAGQAAANQPAGFLRPLADAWLAASAQPPLEESEWSALCAERRLPRLIFGLAKRLDSAGFARAVEESCATYFREIIFRRGGQISDMDLAELIEQHFAGTCWWSDKLGRWAFLEGNAHPKLAHKVSLRQDSHMHEMIEFVQSLRAHGDQVVQELSIQKQAAEDRDQHDRLKKMSNSVRRLVERCGTLTFVHRGIAGAHTKLLYRDLHEKLDADGLCIGVRGGIVRLAHWRGDVFCPPEFIAEPNTHFVSKCADVDYAFDNPWIARWDQVHRDVVVEDDARYFIQTTLATCLDGVTVPNHLLVIKASGCNGKSTLTDSVAATLGPDYFTKGDIMLLTTCKRDSNSADNAMEQLKGKRGMNFSETRADTVLLSDQLKHVIGIEPKNSRANYAAKETFVAYCTMLATTNHILALEDNDDGSWRRIKYYEAKVKFVANPRPHVPGGPLEKKIDPSLGNICLSDREARSGLFMLLLDRHTSFMRDYRGDFAAVPVGATITRTTERIRREQDATIAFFETHLFWVPGHRCSLSSIVDAFAAWRVSRDRKFSMSRVALENHIRNSSIQNDLVAASVSTGAESSGLSSVVDHYFLPDACIFSDPPEDARPYLSVPRRERHPI